jgi:transcription elongation factor Elf1
MENAKATLEWHYECPNCGRSCFSRFYGTSIEGWPVTCSDCKVEYRVEVGHEAVTALLRIVSKGRG